MKKFITVNLFLFAFISLKAQDPYFALFRQNNLWLNPASAGMEDKHVFSLSGRTQWSIYHTAALTYDQPLKKINSGIGGVGWYENDGTGHLRTYYAGLCYNYQIKLAEKMKLGIGLEGAFVHRTIDLSDLVFASQYVNGSFVNSAPTSLKSSTNYLDFNAGLWYKWSDFYVGVSIKHVTEPNVSFLEDGITDKMYQNYIFTAGYKWKFSKHFSMIPSGSFSTQGPANFLQVNDEFCLNDTYFLGGGIQEASSVGEPFSNVNPFMVCGGINWKNKIQLMLAYDFIGPNRPDIPIDWTAYEANIKYRF